MIQFFKITEDQDKVTGKPHKAEVEAGSHQASGVGKAQQPNL